MPDAMLAMVRERRVNTDPGVLWASIDTLSRPDGSLAASAVVMTDGTVIDSTFAAANVGRLVTLPTGETVRVHTEGGSQTFYVGADDEPLLQSKWSPTGPRVVRAPWHLAFLNDPLDPHVGEDVRPTHQPDPKPLGPLVIPTAGVIGLNILVSGVSALYEMFRAAPEAMGAGDADAQIITYKTWSNRTAPNGGPDGKPLVVPVFVGSLTVEQAQDACPLLPQVQSWTDQAAFALAADQPDLDGPRAGIALHNIVKNNVAQAKSDSPFMYRGVYTELSIGSSGDLAPYGDAGTSRLDVVDLRPPERPTVVCDFEIKTGNARLRADQLNDYMRRLAQRYPGATIYVIVVRPKK